MLLSRIDYPKKLIFYHVTFVILITVRNVLQDMEYSFVCLFISYKENSVKWNPEI